MYKLQLWDTKSQLQRYKVTNEIYSQNYKQKINNSEQLSCNYEKKVRIVMRNKVANVKQSHNEKQQSQLWKICLNSEITVKNKAAFVSVNTMINSQDITSQFWEI